MAIPLPNRNPFMTGNRRHRRIAYRATFSRPFNHDEYADLVAGVYRDGSGQLLGTALLEQRLHEMPQAFLVIPGEDFALVHVEASLDADRRVAGYDQVFALLYHASEDVYAGVRDTGDRWDDGELIAYTFETDDEALEAQA